MQKSKKSNLLSLKEIEFSEIKMKNSQFMNTWKIFNQTKNYRINADWFFDMEIEYKKKFVVKWVELFKFYRFSFFFWKNYHTFMGDLSMCVNE